MAVEKLYKLTDPDGKTHSGMQWGPGVTHTLPRKENPRLCTEDVIHAYRDPNLAFLLNPVHGNYLKPQLWQAKGEVVVEDWGKVGCFRLTTIKELSKPKWISKRIENCVRARFAILCAETGLDLCNRISGLPCKVAEAAKKHLEYLLRETEEYLEGLLSEAKKHILEVMLGAEYAANLAASAANTIFFVYEAYAANAAKIEKIDFAKLASQVIKEKMEGEEK